MSNMDSHFAYPADVENFAFNWGRFALTCCPETTGSSTFSAGLVQVPPDQGNTRHNHPEAEEIILVIEGEGEQMIEDETGKPEFRKVGPGCTIYVPKGRNHSTRNIGEAQMWLFVVYTPAGPEQALRDAPHSRTYTEPEMN